MIYHSYESYCGTIYVKKYFRVTVSQAFADLNLCTRNFEFEGSGVSFFSTHFAYSTSHLGKLNITMH